MSAMICTMIWMGFSSILVWATAAAGLPLVSIWWALFRMNLYEEGQPEALGYGNPYHFINYKIVCVEKFLEKSV